MSIFKKNKLIFGLLKSTPLIILFISVLTLAEEKEKLVENPNIMEMHQIANEKRGKCKQCKRPPLELDEECCRMAQDWANHMAKVGKRYHGKNDQIISSGYKDTPTAFSSWMNSSGHKAWILNSKSTKCGWGCQQSKGGRWYRVGVFRK